MRIKNSLSYEKFQKFTHLKSKRFQKYHNIPTMVDGILFQSKKEAQHYRFLKQLQEEGQILYFLRQVPIDLPGGIKYRVDFQVFGKNGEIEYHDVKGFKTKEYLLKKKQVEALYPIRIVEK